MFRSTFLNPENLRQNLTKNPMTLWHYFTSTPTTHSAGKKISFIYKHFDTIWPSPKTTSNKNSIISHAFFWLAHIHYTSSSKTLIYMPSNLLSQRTPHIEPNILPIVTPFSDMGKSFTNTIHKNWHTIANEATQFKIWPSKPLSAYKKSSSIHNHLVHSAQTYDFSQHNY